MEKWEAAHITKHLAHLIKNTRCSAVIKAGLKAKELLSDEEDQRLTALGRNEGSISEAKLLYEIMMTRSRGYSGLMEVLLYDRQDGAWKTLQEGLREPEPQVESADSITQLLNMRVQLGNNTKSFNEIFPNFTRQDAQDLLQNFDLKQELEELWRKGSLEIQLDGEVPLTSDLYISRLLSNRLKLDPRVFSLKSCEDVFVYTNISRMELSQLVKPNAVRSSTSQRSLVTGRHIYLDDDEDWEDMVATSEAPIHLVSKEAGAFILQRTSKVTNVLVNHVLREGRSKDAYVAECAFVEEFVSENDTKGALICDVAGMGKTWLMKNLAAKIRDKSENFIVFFVELSSFSKFLSRLNQPLADPQASQMLLNYVCPSKLASYLLYKFAAQIGPKIVFVFDGYDEISKEDIGKVESNLLILSKLDNFGMIISSRPCMRVPLEKNFNLISYDILPLQREEQVRCIVDQWANAISIPQSDSESWKLEEFASQCIKSVKLIQKCEVHDILGVPLKCRILAIVNEKKAKQLCKAKRRRTLQIVEAATIKSVFDLYTMFVDALVDKVAATLPLDAINDFVNKIHTFYTHMSLELLFPDLSNVYLKHCKIDSSMKEFFRRVGVAYFNNVNQRFEFIHRSFAAYFVEKFFAEFWNDIEQFSPSFVHMVGFYFIRNVMIAFDEAEKCISRPYQICTFGMG